MAAEMYEEDMGASPRRASRKRLSGKKLILFILLPVLLIAGAGAGLFFMGIIGGKPPAADAQQEQQAQRIERGGPAVYHDLPDMLVNLRSDGPRPAYLKISVSLELERMEDRQAVERVLPRVIDTFQVYLRELRPDQLQGSAGLIRLREELLSRINVAVRPARVRDVLFKEMLVQ